jgi:hypothetical protein
VIEVTEYLISIKIEALEEGGYLATSDYPSGIHRTGKDNSRDDGNSAGCSKKTY